MGLPAVYTSESISLAALEVLVHLEKSEVPVDYVALGIELSDDQVRDLSMGEARRVESLCSSPTMSVETFGREFYTHPVLRVPSVIIPREHNYVLLPAAARFQARIL